MSSAQNINLIVMRYHISHADISINDMQVTSVKNLKRKLWGNENTMILLHEECV